MYNISKDLENILLSASRIYNIKITWDNLTTPLTFTSDNIVSIECNSQLCSSDYYTLGCTVAKSIKVEMLNDDKFKSISEAERNNNYFAVSVGIANNTTTTEDESEYTYTYIPIGKYKIDPTTYKEDVLSVSFTAYDFMIELDKYAWGSNKTKLSDIISELNTTYPCEIAGNYTDSTFTPLGTSTARNFIASLATALGRNATIDRESNKILFVKPTTTTFELEKSAYITFDLGNQMQKISGVKAIVEQESNESDNETSTSTTYSAGDDSGTVIDVSSIARNQNDVNTIYANAAFPFTYQPYSVELQGYPHLDCFDIITIVDRNNTSHSLLLQSLTFGISGNMTTKATISAYPANETINSSGNQGSGILSQEIRDLKADNLSTRSLVANKADIDLANINQGCITTAMIGTGVIGTSQIADGSITDAKIVGLTANKITAGTLDAANINVTNLNADNITTGTINGQRIGDIDVGKLVNNTDPPEEQKLRPEAAKDYIDLFNETGSIDTETVITGLDYNTNQTMFQLSSIYNTDSNTCFFVKDGETSSGYAYGHLVTTGPIDQGYKNDSTDSTNYPPTGYAWMLHNGFSYYDFYEDSSDYYSPIYDFIPNDNIKGQYFKHTINHRAEAKYTLKDGSSVYGEFTYGLSVFLVGIRKASIPSYGPFYISAWSIATEDSYLYKPSTLDEYQCGTDNSTIVEFDVPDIDGVEYWAICYVPCRSAITGVVRDDVSVFPVANYLAVKERTIIIGKSGIQENLLGTNAVSNRVIQADAITGDKIVANAITGDKIAAATITANNLAAGAISAQTISASQITSGTISADRLDTASLRTGSFTMTGGSINISSSDKTENRIQLNYFSTYDEAGEMAYSAICPYQIEFYRRGYHYGTVDGSYASAVVQPGMISLSTRNSDMGGGTYYSTMIYSSGIETPSITVGGKSVSTTDHTHSISLYGSRTIGSTSTISSTESSNYFLYGPMTFTNSELSSTINYTAKHIKTSDERLKENIADLTNIENLYLGLRPVEFNYKAGIGQQTDKEYGFIAQDVEKLVDEYNLPSGLVFIEEIPADDPCNESQYIPDGKIHMMNKEYLHAMTVQMVQKLWRKCEEQQKEINELKADLTSLKLLKNSER